MRNSRRILKIIIFLMIVNLLNGMMNYILYPYTYSRAEMHHMEGSDLNQLVVGSSHGKCGINPASLDAVMGTKTFNSCQGGEYPMDSYYLVREADRVHELKQVIYELDPGYWVTGDGQNAQYIAYLREFPNSTLKLVYWKDKLLDGDFRSTLFPWYFYRNQLMNIPEIVKQKQSDAYRNYSFEPFSGVGQTCREDGYIYRNRVETEKIPVDPLNLWKDENLNQESVKWFEKMYEYCKEEDIELIVVVTPVPEETLNLYPENYQKGYDYLERYMAGKELLYLNYSRGDDDRFSRKLADFADQEGHMYGDAAEVFSRCFGEDILDKLN